MFVLEHHYAGSYPAAKLRYGLVDRIGDRLVGVCVLGIPMQDKVLSNVFPGLRPGFSAVGLSRLVLLDDPVVGVLRVPGKREAPLPVVLPLHNGRMAAGGMFCCAHRAYRDSSRRRLRSG
ncbi:MAG: hypothetical protein M0Z95_11135 [Actinomycetota bacterium]|nr:hypothetical protein [Actinomycetota bacterium]